MTPPGWDEGHLQLAAHLSAIYIRRYLLRALNVHMERSKAHGFIGRPREVSTRVIAFPYHQVPWSRRCASTRAHMSTAEPRRSRLPDSWILIC